MIPANERFKARDPLAAGADYRLIFQVQFSTGNGLAQILLELTAILGIGVHGRRIEAIKTAPVGLGGVECKISVADERLGTIAVRWRDRDADRYADHNLAAVDRVRQRESVDDVIGQLGHVFEVIGAGEDNLELVAAQAAHFAVGADQPEQALRHLAQQRVARRMTHRIVHFLEAIEIEQEQRAGAGH